MLRVVRNDLGSSGRQWTEDTERTAMAKSQVSTRMQTSAGLKDLKDHIN